MKKVLVFCAFMLLNACSTKYILMDESHNPVQDGYYTDSSGYISGSDENQLVATEGDYANSLQDNRISANDVFVVNEGMDFVTYQYKNVRVDEISPLASLYCADTVYGTSPYLREVSMYHNGFMRATFDCLNVAI